MKHVHLELERLEQRFAPGGLGLLGFFAGGVSKSEPKGTDENGDHGSVKDKAPRAVAGTKAITES